MIELRIFVASPGDVGEERGLAARVIERLRLEWAGRAALVPIFWEHEPLRASASFQEELPLPSEADIAVFILWSRLGTRLPGSLRREDGSRYASGTEFELEDALRGFKEHGRPEILVYRKTALPSTDLVAPEVVLERLRQKQALDELIGQRFREADGSFVSSFHDFPGPAVFEARLEEHLRKLIVRRVEEAGLATGGLAPLWQQGSPFRGLSSYEFEHAPIFFGRTEEVAELLDALRRQAVLGRPFVLISGPSGGGKSSLVRAGLVPALTSPGAIEGVGLWRRATVDFAVTSGGDPCRALARGLLAGEALPELAAEIDQDELGRQLAEQPESVVPFLRSALSLARCRVQQQEGLAHEPQARLALVLDPLDDLLGAEYLTGDDLRRFGKAVAVLTATGVVWSVATLRDDLWPRLEKMPDLQPLVGGAGRYQLAAPSTSALGRIVRQPARMAGLRYEEDPVRGVQLDDLLRDAAAADPQALPLLSFTLEELYRRQEENGLLTLAAYRELGGVEGSLARRAEDAFSALPKSAQDALGEALTVLVKRLESGAFVRRWASENELASSGGARTLIDRFVDQGLLVRRLAEDGGIRLGVVHEALFKSWPRAQAWIEENQDVLALRSRLRAHAALWQEADRAEDALLPDGPLLRAATALTERSAAPLLGLEGDLVTASLAAEEARRKRLLLQRGALAAGGILVVVAVMVWIWLYQAPHVTYYHDATTRFGIPVGIGALDGDTVKRRQWSLKLTRQGRRGPVKSLEAVDGEGRLTPYNQLQPLVFKFNTGTDITAQICALEFVYGEDRTLSRSTAKNCFGKVLWRLEHQHHEGTTEAQTLVYVDEKGIPTDQTKTGIAIVKVRRDVEGRDLEQWFLDRGGDPCRDERYAFGYLLEGYAEDGRPRRQITLDREREPAVGADGCGQFQLRYGDDGRLASLSCHDLQGRRTLSIYGAAQFDYEYDEAGNLIAWSLLDEELQPRELARFRWTYDERGRRVEERYESTAGAVYNRDGIAGKRWDRFDERGLWGEEAYLDADGQRLEAWNGCAIERRSYDPQGRIVEAACFDRNERRARDAEGKSKLIREYIDQDRRQIERYLDPADQPVRTARGYSKVVRLFDPRGQEVETTFFDTEQRSVCGFPQPEAQDFYTPEPGVFLAQHQLPNRETSPRFARRKREYNARGKVEREVLLDSANQPIPGAEVSEIRRVFGLAGETLSESFLDRGGRFADNRAGYARTAREYDDRGQLIAEEYRDEAGSLKEIRHVEYDDRGRPIEERFTDAAGRLIASGRSYARVLYRRNDQEQRLETAYFDALNNAEGSGGWAVHSQRWDFFGNPQEEVYLNASRQPVENESGIGRIVYEYDERHRQTRVRYLDAWSKPVVVGGGYATLEAEYDAWVRPIELRYFDSTQRPRRSGPARVEMDYDDLGRLEKIRYLDPDNKEVPGELGCAILELDSNPLGDIVELRCLDAGRRAARSVYGFASAGIRSDDCGMALEVELRDASGQVIQEYPVDPRFNPLAVEQWQNLPPASAPPSPVSRQTEIRTASGNSSSTTQTQTTTEVRQTKPQEFHSANSGATLQELVRLSGRVQDAYERFLDRTDRDIDGEEEDLEELFEDFADAADEARDAHRRLSGRGSGLRDLFGRSPGRVQEKLEREVRAMRDLSARIDRLAARYPIGSEAEALWEEIRQRLSQL